MAADLWKELSLMGSWISDATVLRWAELTAEISQGALKPSQVIDYLLQSPIPERDKWCRPGRDVCRTPGMSDYCEERMPVQTPGP